jgi:cytochrome c2
MNVIRLSVLKNLIIVFLLCAVFVYGVAVGKLNIFPYRQMAGAYQKITATVGPVFRGKSLGAKADSWVLETNLFSVRVTTHSWPQKRVSYSRGGGGIVALGNQIVGVEKNGEFFTFNKATGVQALGNALVTNIEDLALKGNDPEDPGEDALRSFRFTDIEAKLIEGSAYIFVIYHYWHIDKECKTTRVSEIVIDDFENVGLSAQALNRSDWRLIFESQPCLKFSYRNASAFQSPNTGGRLALDGQNNLFVSLGDHHIDGVNNPDIAAQGDEFDYGKIIKIDLHSLQSKIYAYGLRNPQGLIVDEQGKLWETEHGPRGGDELNLIRAGANYGWPLTTFGTQYYDWNWSLNETQGRHYGFELPTYAWVPSIGVSNLIRIHDKPALWQGDLLISSLRTGSLYRVRLHEGRAVFSEPIQIGERIRDITLMVDGSIVLWTDANNIISVVAEPEDVEENVTSVDRLAAMGVPNDLQAIVENCMTCHSLSQDIVRASAPSLWGIAGRNIAATDYQYYSKSLSGKRDDLWDEGSLAAFLRNPQEFAPGTTMPAAEVGGEQTLKALVGYLQTLQ